MPVLLLVAACCAVPVTLAGAVFYGGWRDRLRRKTDVGLEEGTDLRDAGPGSHVAGLGAEPGS